WWHRQVDIPKALPHRGRPQKLADPDSKTSKTKQAARHRVQHALAGHLQEAYAEAMTPYNIAGEIWEQVSFGDHKLELTEEMRIIGDKMIIRSAKHQMDEYQLTKQYVAWVARVEEAHILNEKKDAQEAQRCKGRAPGFGIRWIRAKPTPGRTHMRYGPAEEWSTLAADVVRYQSLVVNGTDVKQQSMRVKRILRQIGVLRGISHKDAFSKHDTEISSSMYFQMTEDILDLDLGQLAHLVGQTEKYLAKASSRSMATARKSFATWAKKAWQTKAGTLHRHVKPKEAPRYEMTIRPDFATADPTIIMRSKASTWETIWADPVDTRTDIIEQLEHTRRRARHEDPDPIDMEMPN
ncbi:unnamed protein product, partial [Prorocentrum cordatum]